MHLFFVATWNQKSVIALLLLMFKIWRGEGILPGMHTLCRIAFQKCLKTIASAGVGANLNSQFCP